jgi:hypothetical protein
MVDEDIVMELVDAVFMIDEDTGVELVDDVFMIDEDIGVELVDSKPKNDISKIRMIIH